MRVTPLDRLRKEARFALATQAYRTGTVRLASRDMSGCDHLVATRHGLFVVNPRAYRLIAHGVFYGITIVDDAIYVFEAGDRPRSPTRRGRIVRLRRAGDTIVAADVIATDLDNGCHQIDVVRGALHVVDTYNQQIVVLDLDGGGRRIVRPLQDQGQGDRSGPHYRHINSLIQHDDSVLVLLHSGGHGGGGHGGGGQESGEGARSEVATFDADWTLVACTALEGHGCHGFALLEDGTLLSCGSRAGELIGSSGLKVALGDMMTRGLSVDATHILVGGSTVSPRDIRDDMGGAVYFLDRAYRRLATLAMPAPVMEIRRIDGRDRSLSLGVAAAASRPPNPTPNATPQAARR